MVESSISLELKLLYGKGITGFNFFQKLLIYTAVSLFSHDLEKKLNQAQKQRTAADKEGDGSPEWNHEIRFDLNGIPLSSDDVFLLFDLYHEGVMFGDKHIGQVRVPLRDFTDDAAAGVVRFVSYEVKGPDGKPNGVLTFSYKLNGVGHGGSVSSGITGYAIVDQNHQQEPAESENPTSEIVTYPTLEEFDHSPPPPAVNYYPPPESYYPPPPAPPVVYPMPQVWPPGPPMRHHHHHHHHHHHLWGHDPNLGDGGRLNSFEERGWRREDPYAPPWTGR